METTRGRTQEGACGKEVSSVGGNTMEHPAAAA